MLIYKRGVGWIQQPEGVKCVDALGKKRVLYHRQPQKGEAGFSLGRPDGNEDLYKTSDNLTKWDACIKHVRSGLFNSESIHVGRIANEVYVTVLYDNE